MSQHRMRDPLKSWRLVCQFSMVLNLLWQEKEVKYWELQGTRCHLVVVGVETGRSVERRSAEFCGAVGSSTGARSVTSLAPFSVLFLAPQVVSDDLDFLWPVVRPFPGLGTDRRRGRHRWGHARSGGPVRREVSHAGTSGWATCEDFFRRSVSSSIFKKKKKQEQWNTQLNLRRPLSHASTLSHFQLKPVCTVSWPSTLCLVHCNS